MGRGGSTGAISANSDRGRAVVVFPGQSSREVCVPELLEEWRPELLETLSAALGHDDAFWQAQVSLAAEQAVTVSCSLASWHEYGRPSPRYVLRHSTSQWTAFAGAR